MPAGTTGIVTPEAVVLEFALPGVAARSLSLLLDLLVMSAVLTALFVVGGLVLVPIDPDGTASVVVAVVGVAAVFFGYPMASETLTRGRTLGKLALGHRVVTVEGGPIRFRHAAIRSVFWLVDFLLPPGGATAVLTALSTTRGQRLGDVVAGTMVVGVRDEALRAGVWFAPPRGLEVWTAGLDTGRVTAEQYRVLRSYLLRFGSLAGPARAEVGERLEAQLQAIVGRPRPPWMHPFDYLVSIASAWQRRTLPATVGVGATPGVVPAGPATWPGTGALGGGSGGAGRAAGPPAAGYAPPG